jgi:hypothetical protein
MFTVTADLLMEEPLNREQLEAAASLGGVAVGNTGGTRLSATMTIEARDANAAADEAVRRLRKLVPALSTSIALDVLPCAEFDQREGLPAQD